MEVEKQWLWSWRIFHLKASKHRQLRKPDQIISQLYLRLNQKLVIKHKAKSPQLSMFLQTAASDVITVSIT